MSGPSEKAVQAGHDALQEMIGWSGHRDGVTARVRPILVAAHDPALGLDQSVCLRDVVETLRRYPRVAGAPSHPADFIERQFTTERITHA